jgi:hypothetical protein
LLLNDAVVRKDVREVIMLSTKAIKPLTWPVIDFASAILMETSLYNGTLDFVTKG